MSRDYQGSADRHVGASGFGITDDITMSIWINPDVITSIRIAFGIGDSNDPEDNEYLLGLWDAAPVANAVYWQGRGVGEFTRNATSTAGATIGEWAHICGVREGGATDPYRAFLNGGNKGVNPLDSSNFAGGAMDRTTIGTRARSGFGLDFDGKCAFGGLWDVALTDEEVASLFYTHPKFVRPQSLIDVMELPGSSAGVEVGLISGLNYIQTGTVGVFESPMVLMGNSLSIQEILAQATAVLSGTILDTTQESDIVAGGKVVSIDLTGATFVP